MMHCTCSCFVQVNKWALHLINSMTCCFGHILADTGKDIWLSNLFTPENKENQKYRCQPIQKSLFHRGMTRWSISIVWILPVTMETTTAVIGLHVSLRWWKRTSSLYAVTLQWLCTTFTRTGTQQQRGIIVTPDYSININSHFQITDHYGSDMENPLN